jgi:NAD(P)H-dependent flavin oxidoreductase YrpB (nitropropane dioxygenase family)
LLKNSMVDGKPDIGVCSGGQVVGLIEDLPSCKELIDRIMHQAEEVLERMGA